MPLTQVQGGMLAGSTNTTTTIQSNGTTAITIDSSQRVGIGTASPTGKLHVYGSGEVQTLQRSASNVNNYTLFKTESGADQAYLGFSDSGVNDFAIFNVQNGYVRIATNNTERMRITSGGKVLIGTTSTLMDSEAELGVSNSSGVTMNVRCAASSGGAGIHVQRSASTGNLLFFTQGAGATYVGQINTNGTSTSYSSASDYRLKENIQPITNALARVQSLKPCTFKFKSDGSNGEGFIAHELAEVCPDAVTGEKDAVDADGKPVYQGVDTSFLVATLTAAIQELNAKVEAQAAEIAALKAAP